jgi:hypothetical protein
LLRVFANAPPGLFPDQYLALSAKALRERGKTQGPRVCDAALAAQVSALAGKLAQRVQLSRQEQPPPPQPPASQQKAEAEAAHEVATWSSDEAGSASGGDD